MIPSPFGGGAQRAGEAQNTHHARNRKKITGFSHKLWRARSQPVYNNNWFAKIRASNTYQYRQSAGRSLCSR